MTILMCKQARGQEGQRHGPELGLENQIVTGGGGSEGLSMLRGPVTDI